MNSKLKTPEMDHLFEAILTLRSVDECYKLFSDVCTIKELLAMAQRFEVALMLTEKITYLDIAEKIGASTATISRVNRSLSYGEDGYDLVFRRLGIIGDGETAATEIAAPKKASAPAAKEASKS